MRLAKSPNYHEILTEAEWRAIQCGFPYGFSNVLLPELRKAEDRPEPTEQAIGLVLLYGMGIWPGYAYRPSMSSMRKACDRFGIIGAESLPYAHRAKPIWATGYSPPALRVLGPIVRYAWASAFRRSLRM